jgi:replication initiation protein RepC
MTDHILAARNHSGRQGTKRYVQNLQATHTPPSVRSELLAAAKDSILTLRLGPSASALLGLLVSCISTDRVVNGLMVWPSNAWLQARSGQSERTIQRGVLRLCAEGLIEVARSANGKRFARRDRFGTISQAFGFSLLPLFSRRQDLAARAVRKREDEEARQMARRQIAAGRRAVSEFIQRARRYDDQVVSMALQAALDALPSPRSASISLSALLRIADQMADLVALARARTEVPDNLTGSGRQIVGRKEEQIESYSNTEVSDAAAGSERTGDRQPVKTQRRSFHSSAVQYPGERAPTGAIAAADLGIFDAERWRIACPAAKDADLPLDTMSDIVETGVLLSFCIGAHRDALLEATQKLGHAGCALVSLYVYQMIVNAELNGTPMANPGARFRAIVRDVASGAQSLDRSISELERRAVSVNLTIPLASIL